MPPIVLIRAEILPCHNKDPSGLKLCETSTSVIKLYVFRGHRQDFICLFFNGVLDRSLVNLVIDV